MNLSTLIILTIATVPLISCGGERIQVGATTPLASKVQGTWKSECQNDKTHGGSTTEALTFTNERVQSTLSIYQDFDCQTPALKVEIEGTFKIAAPESSSLIANTHEINFDAKVTKITSLLQTWVDLNNRENECGFANWKATVPKDVAKVPTCSHAWGIAQAQFSIFKRDGNNLYLGDGPTTGTSEDARESKLSTIPFKRLPSPAPSGI